MRRPSCFRTRPAGNALPLLAALLGAIVTTGCIEEIPNPSGSCPSLAHGSRAGYHVPDSAQWLPDCQNPRLREYWSVFATSRASAYTIARVDGEPLLRVACEDPQHALAPLVKKYLLCAPSSDPRQVEKINDMDPADALEITRFLHGVLRFTVPDQGPGVLPVPIPEDVLAACALHPQTNSPELNAACESERRRLASGATVSINYSGPLAVEVARLLNELYGIALP